MVWVEGGVAEFVLLPASGGTVPVGPHLDGTPRTRHAPSPPRVGVMSRGRASER